MWRFISLLAYRDDSINANKNTNVRNDIIFNSMLDEVNWSKSVVLTLKEPGNPPPPQHFLLYLSRLLFFRAETSWLFFFKPCAQFKTIFLKIRPGVMTRRCVIERWVQRKTDQKLIFNGNYTQIMFFVFFLFQDTLSLCFISFIWFIWSKNMCKHTLTHIIAKNATFAWKKGEKPWFWRFLVIFVFLTWRHLWRHCGVIQGMFVLFLVPMDSGGS